MADNIPVVCIEPAGGPLIRGEESQFEACVTYGHKCDELHLGTPKTNEEKVQANKCNEDLNSCKQCGGLCIYPHWHYRPQGQQPCCLPRGRRWARLWGLGAPQARPMLIALWRWARLWGLGAPQQVHCRAAEYTITSSVHSLWRCRRHRHHHPPHAAPALSIEPRAQ